MEIATQLPGLQIRYLLAHSTLKTFAFILSFCNACVFHSLRADERAKISTETPNILVVMADDLGYGDISCNGFSAVQTPNIDALAQSGIRFTSGYCSASTCTPTRFSLLTGTYAFRQKGTGVAPPNSPALIQPGTETIATLLKRKGYRTAVVGKWHLGLGAASGPNWNGPLKPGPNEIGFDHSLILPTTNDRVPQVYVKNGLVMGLDPADPLWVGDKKPSEDHPTGTTHRSALKMDWSHGHNQTVHNGIGRIGFYTGGEKARFRDEDLADRWVAEAKDWIEKKSDDPFFLFFSSHDVHVPRAVHERFVGKSGLGPRGDAILEFDWSVGELIRSLERSGKREDTLVILCSDNGPVLDDGYKDDAIEKLGTHQPAGPFQGGKYNIYEAGTRIPFLVSWPSRVEPGTVSDEIVCTIDFASSFASLLQIQMPDDACLDSFDVMDALLGKRGAKGRETLLQQDNGSGNYGLRHGKWKLQRHRNEKANNVSLRLVPTPQRKLQLFDLESDPSEKYDLSDSQPAMVQELDHKISRIVEEGRTRFPK